MVEPLKGRPLIENLLYGREGARRFTQDSPVLPDVWIAFAEAPEQPQALLTTPNMDPGEHGAATAGQVRKELFEKLSAHRRLSEAWAPREKDGPAPVVVAHNQATVLATLWFDELVRVVLPLSTWWFERVRPTDFDEVIGKLDAAGKELLEKLLDNPDLSAAEFAEFHLAPDWKKPSHDLLWTLRVVGTIAAARRKSLAKQAADAAKPPKRKTKAAPPQLVEASNAEQVEAADQPFQGVDLEAVSERPLVWNVSLDRPARAMVEASRTSVKADAAARVFEPDCEAITWAVVDSGIDAQHPAFRKTDPKTGKRYAEPFPARKPTGGAVRVKATYDFNYVERLLGARSGAETGLPPWLMGRLEKQPELEARLAKLRDSLNAGAAVDWAELTPFIQVPHVAGEYAPPSHEHGTHVAGILAADWIPPAEDSTEPRPPGGLLRGVCPQMHLIDVRVLDVDGGGREFNVITALQFIRFLNSRQDFMAAHGANLSLSLPHDVSNYACGRTPICAECERLVGSGAVVVAAAGNLGYQKYVTAGGLLKGYNAVSITDPGNAESVITVGSTHRTQPHAYGVSFFSSRGPTGDGRLKPDVVAPGEKITGPVPAGGYKLMDGTSMAAPHVSGVAALLLARHRELIGQPARVKEVLCRSATDLGRERCFQGHGMIDALRALQSV